jgi:hypothetical protein
VSQVKHHDWYAARGISCSCLNRPHLWVSRAAAAARAEETTLSIRMLFDGRRKDHELKLTLMQEARVFYRDVRQQKIEMIASRKENYRTTVIMKSKENVCTEYNATRCRYPYDASAQIYQSNRIII